METDSFAVLILTHGRPDKMLTHRALRRQGYTGPIYIIVDNEDETIDQYRENFADPVIVFDKAAIADRIDEGDNFGDRRTVLYARNASFDIARELGVDWFLQLDDDYPHFEYKFDSQLRFVVTGKYVKSLDRLFATMLRYYKAIPAAELAMAQNGDFQGGSQSSIFATKIGVRRKAMNTLFLSPSREFRFVARMNDDVTTYVMLGHRGRLCGTINQVAIAHKATQSLGGGISEVYRAEGTYRKSFYPVMYAPSCVRISTLSHQNPRVHHKIYWRKAVPLVLSEIWRKPREDTEG